MGQMDQLYAISHFVHRLRIQMRFGELSRAPLKLLRLQLQGESAECDWMARPPDLWDADLPSAMRERNASLQALEDAIAMRGLLLHALPDIHSAVFRVYRQAKHGPDELMMTGEIAREDDEKVRVLSIAMRAKLLGFRFFMENGILQPLQSNS